MLRLVIINLREICKSAAFWACVAITVILCLTSSVTIPTQNAPVTVFSVLCDFSRDELLSDTAFCDCQMFLAYRNGYLSLFSSMLVIFPFVNFFSTQREARMQRYFLIRMNRFAYGVGQMVSLAVSGCCAMGLGLILYGGLIWLHFPHLQEYPNEMAQIFLDTIWNGSQSVSSISFGTVFAFMLIHFLCFLLYSLCSSGFGMLILSLFQNRYLILTIPFFLQYLLRQSSTAFNSFAFQDTENPIEGLHQFAEILSPEATRDLPWNTPKEAVFVFVVHVGLLLIAMAVFYCVGNRRIDVGDF